MNKVHGYVHLDLPRSSLSGVNNLILIDVVFMFIQLLIEQYHINVNLLFPFTDALPGPSSVSYSFSILMYMKMFEQLLMRQLKRMRYTSL